MLVWVQTYFSQLKTRHMKKIVFLLPFAVSTIFTFAQSKEVLKKGVADPAFATIIGMAKDSDHQNYILPAAQVYPPAASSTAFLTEVQQYCDSKEEQYFTPTTLVGTVAKLLTEQRLSHRRPNFFMVETGQQKKKDPVLAVVMVAFDHRNDIWTYQTIHPDDIITLPSGAVLYHAL